MYLRYHFGAARKKDNSAMTLGLLEYIIPCSNSTRIYKNRIIL